MTNRAAAALHRRLDQASAEAMARDGRETFAANLERPGALIPPRLRKRDMRIMDRPREPRVLLIQLTQRTSGRGNPYLSGWLGKAKLVGFKSEPDEHGNERWDVYAAEPGQRPATAPVEPRQPRPQQQPARRPSARPGPPVGDGVPFYDDDLADIGR